MITVFAKVALLACLGFALHGNGFTPDQIMGWVSVLVLAMVPEGIV